MDRAREALVTSHDEGFRARSSPPRTPGIRERLGKPRTIESARMRDATARIPSRASPVTVVVSILLQFIAPDGIKRRSPRLMRHAGGETRSQARRTPSPIDSLVGEPTQHVYELEVSPAQVCQVERFGQPEQRRVGKVDGADDVSGKRAARPDRQRETVPGSAIVGVATALPSAAANDPANQ